ncbi:hypothetical protein GCM10022248_31040 [Nonomuraea soli]
MDDRARPAQQECQQRLLLDRPHGQLGIAVYDFESTQYSESHGSLLDPHKDFWTKGG